MSKKLLKYNLYILFQNLLTGKISSKKQEFLSSHIIDLKSPKVKLKRVKNLS